MRKNISLHLAQVSLVVIVLGCKQERHLPSTTDTPSINFQVSLKTGNREAIEASVERSKRTGFPSEDSQAAEKAVTSELEMQQPTDATIVDLSDLLLQAENNKRHKLAPELRRKIFVHLQRIQVSEEFPTNIVATSVIGFYETDEAVFVLADAARRSKGARFKAAVLALAYMCNESAALALDQIGRSSNLSIDQQSALREAIASGKANRRSCS